MIENGEGAEKIIEMWGDRRIEEDDEDDDEEIR